jgi:hypothetical protein
MDAALFVVVMLAALLVAGLVIGRAQRKPRPDDPVAPQQRDEAGEPTDASDARDRPGGPSAEHDTPHSPELQPGEQADPDAGAEDIARPSGNVGNERDPGSG